MMNNDIDKTKFILEDYLKAIAILKKSNGKATVTALSRMIGVRKPSIYRSLKRLYDDELVVHERYGDIDLTPKGKKMADEVCHRHGVLFRFFTEVLNVEPATAMDDACRMEHVLSRKSIEQIEALVGLRVNGDGKNSLTQKIRLSNDFGQSSIKHV
jgi:DtxR family Mn-dependent transcriptional regulator